MSSGRDERSIWAECQGSGAKPYQTQIDLSEPAFKCSCPSRKFPCKHALGLFLLLVGSGVNMIALLALSDDGAPSFDHAIAAALSALGIPTFDTVGEIVGVR